jgi:hypothetical protein
MLQENQLNCRFSGLPARQFEPVLDLLDGCEGGHGSKNATILIINGYERSIAALEGRATHGCPLMPIPGDVSVTADAGVVPTDVPVPDELVPIRNTLRGAGKDSSISKMQQRLDGHAVPQPWINHKSRALPTSFCAFGCTQV